MGILSVAFRLQHHALLLAPQRNQRGVLRNRAAGNVKFHSNSGTFSTLIPFYSGSIGINQMERKIIEQVKATQIINLTAPPGGVPLGTGGQNVHTEAGLAIIAKRLIRFNSMLTSIDLQIFTEKEPCSDCLAELRVVNKSPSIRRGSITLYKLDENNRIAEVSLA